MRDAAGKPGDAAGPGVRVRPCRFADRVSIEAVGHPPALAAMLCPSPARRAARRLLGTRAVTMVAEDAPAGASLGCVQFLRSRRDPGTWMFGHWRTLAARRRQGIGRRLLEEGMRLLPDVARLYSYVECDNESSIAAHRRLGFETGGTHRGNVPLGVLSTVGPATPALRLDPVRAADWSRLFAIYVRAMGSLWVRLFPRIGPHNFLGGRLGGLRAGAVAVARYLPALGTSACLVREKAVGAGIATAGFVVWDGAGVTFFAEPHACDPALLARLALQILARGARRNLEIDILGLPASVAARPGPLAVQVLMGMPDVRTQWRW